MAFGWNVCATSAVEEIVEAMERKYGPANRVWVMDRGMVSEENLKFFMEDVRAMDAAIGPGRCAADAAGRVVEDQERRRGASNP
jgi:hypothetical protein